MNDLIEEYLSTIGITSVALLTRITLLLERVESATSEAVTDILVEDYFDGAMRVYSHLTALTSKYQCVVENFQTEDVLRLYSRHLPIIGIEIQCKDYEFGETPTDASRLVIKFRNHSSELQPSSFRAASDNCSRLYDFYKSDILPDLSA